MDERTQQILNAFSSSLYMLLEDLREMRIQRQAALNEMRRAVEKLQDAIVEEESLE